MLDSSYQMTLKLHHNCIFGVKTLNCFDLIIYVPVNIFSAMPLRNVTKYVQHKWFIDFGTMALKNLHE